VASAPFAPAVARQAAERADRVLPSGSPIVSDADAIAGGASVAATLANPVASTLLTVQP